VNPASAHPWWCPRLLNPPWHSKLRSPPRHAGFYTHCGTKDYSYVVSGATWVGQAGFTAGILNEGAAAYGSVSPQYYRAGCEGPISLTVPNCKHGHSFLDGRPLTSGLILIKHGHSFLDGRPLTSGLILIKHGHSLLDGRPLTSGLTH
jgi:hypothetical protein